MPVDHVRFEFYLPPPMDVGVAIFGVEVLVGAWDVGAALASAGGSVLPTMLVGMVSDNTSSSWWNMTRHRTRSALVSTT